MRASIRSASKGILVLTGFTIYADKPLLKDLLQGVFLL
jgi:hypothetical protein